MLYSGFVCLLVCLLFFGHLDTNWVILAEDAIIDWPVGKSVGVFSSFMFDGGGGTVGIPLVDRGPERCKKAC